MNAIREARPWIWGSAKEHFVPLVLIVFLASLGVTRTSAEVRTEKSSIETHIIRDLVDPCLGYHWQLVTDAAYPSRPGRLVLAESTDQPAARVSTGVEQIRQTDAPVKLIKETDNHGGTRILTGEPSVEPIIRTGDAVRVTQLSSVLRAQFNAVALESALIGKTLRVRLIFAHAGGIDNRMIQSWGPVISVVATKKGNVDWRMGAAAGAGKKEVKSMLEVQP